MQRIGFVLFPGFQTMSLAASSVFEFANLASPVPAYDIRLLSESGGAVRTSIGFAVQSEAFGRAVFDTLIVCGGTDLPPPMPAVEAYLRRSLKKSRRTAAICTGAFLLGAAGGLDGRRATTHWLFGRELQARFPQAKVEDDRIFIADDSVWTSAGMSAGVDLALAMVEQDLGSDIARVVARQLVVYHRRSGGQSQFSALLQLAPKTDRIQKALDYAKQNLKSELSVEQLAGAASLSPRQFSRAFRVETGQSPAKAVEHLRLEAARLMMEQTRHSIDVIADETGFADRERMRRAFVRTYGQPPQAIRRAF